MSNFVNMLTNIFIYRPNKSRKFELLEDDDDYINTKSKVSDNDHGSEGAALNNKTGTGRRTKKLANRKEQNEAQKGESVEKTKIDSSRVVKNLQENIEIVKQRFNLPKNQDIILRKIKIGRMFDACLLFVEGAVDKNTISQFILTPLMTHEYYSQAKAGLNDYIVENVLTINLVKKQEEFNKISLDVLNGFTALFIDGYDECLLIDSKGFEKRNVDKPTTETVVKGSHEGFSENLHTNLSLVRKIIRNEKLITEIMPVGKTNNSTCAVVYLDGLASPELIKEVKRRIEKIDVDFVNGDGMLEQLIEDNPFMIFPQVINTERPDRAASFIMEGQVVIIADGTPFASAVPVTFFRLFHTSEDSNLRWEYGTFLRFIRLGGMFTSFLIPGLYVALTLYHQEMIPSELLISIIKAREKVPFPGVVEVLIMELAFELIREGGIRVPGVIGQTLGIIGALILGQAAVAAGLVSPILIIIVAVTGLGSFAIPNYSLAIGVRILRFVIIFFGAIAGFYGITIITLIFAGLACNMKSFGVPFFAPIAPRTKVNPDVLIRQPIHKQKNRSDGLNTKDRKRMGDTPTFWIRNRKKGR